MFARHALTPCSQGQQAVQQREYPGQRMPMPQVQQFFLEGMRPEIGHMGSLARTMAQPPPAISKTFTIRNDVNLKKNTLKLVRDEANASRYHLEFTFDAATDCTIRVYYVASEQGKVGADGVLSFTTLKEEGAHPKESRSKGLSQTFRTRESHSLDASLYAPTELTYQAGSKVFPLVVCLEAAGGANGQPKSAVQSQTTFASISAADASGNRTITPLKQKIQVGATSYELQEIYGIDGATASGTEAGGESGDGAEEGGDNGRDCVICMTEPRDTTVLPCRHMCMCSDCAKTLRMQSEKCPICRTPIEQLLQIKITKQGDGQNNGTAATPAAAGAALVS
jgi:E3 ubiquitin-protein ligase MGRN1